MQNNFFRKVKYNNKIDIFKQDVVLVIWGYKTSVAHHRIDVSEILKNENKIQI